MKPSSPEARMCQARPREAHRLEPLPPYTNPDRPMIPCLEKPSHGGGRAWHIRAGLAVLKRCFLPAFVVATPPLTAFAEVTLSGNDQTRQIPIHYSPIRSVTTAPHATCFYITKTEKAFCLESSPAPKPPHKRFKVTTSQFKFSKPRPVDRLKLHALGATQ